MRITIVSTIALIIFSTTLVVCAPIQSSSALYREATLAKRAGDVPKASTTFGRFKSLFTGRTSKMLGWISGKASKLFRFRKGSQIAKTKAVAPKVKSKVTPIASPKDRHDSPKTGFSFARTKKKVEPNPIASPQNSHDLSQLPLRFSDDSLKALKAMKDEKLKPDELPRDLYDARAKALYIVKHLNTDLAGSAIDKTRKDSAKALLKVLGENGDIMAREAFESLSSSQKITPPPRPKFAPPPPPAAK
ncbi:hypothetical protein FRB93_000406 [Tulasnella sp. JGI-2019a]|nr:hypothetical protein FRB93_000406 [Tulasnella sp. JGI-2019a]